MHWTTTEDAILREFCLARKTLDETVAALGRTKISIQQRKDALGGLPAFKLPSFPKAATRADRDHGSLAWTQECDAQLAALSMAGVPYQEIAKALDRTYCSVLHRRSRLKLPCRQATAPSPKFLDRQAKRLRDNPPHKGHVIYPVIERDGVPSKCCSKCETWKPLAGFGKSSNGTNGGVRNICKICEYASQKKRLAEDPDARSASVQNALRYQARHPEKTKIIRQVCRHRRRVRELDGPGITTEEWEEIVARFGGICAYCKIAPGTTMDHVVPLSHGGAHAPSNVVPACRKCNSSKHASTPEEWAVRLAARARKPS